MKKKGFTLIELLAVIVVLAIIALIATPSILGIVESVKKQSCKINTKMMEDSAYNYIALEGITVNEGDKLTIPLKALTNGENTSGKKYLKTIVDANERTKECTGYVEASKTNGEYAIAGHLVCPNYCNSTEYVTPGEEEERKEVYSKGANPDNWVMFGRYDQSSPEGILWRIVKSDDEGILLVYEGLENGGKAPIEDGRAYFGKTAGIAYNLNDGNSYTGSTIQERLNQFYNQIYVVNKTNYVKERSYQIGLVPDLNPTYKETVSHFASETKASAPVGLLSIWDYMNASDNDLCKETYQSGGASNPCSYTGSSVNNYLFKNKYNTWTVNGLFGTTDKAWYINNTGQITTGAVDNSTISVRPVLNLKKEVSYLTGSGTLEDPYILEDYMVGIKNGPMIKLVGDDVVTLREGDSYIELGATAEDPEDGDISSLIEITSTVNINQAGTYQVTYQVKDHDGNKAPMVIRTVVVKAKENPMIQLNGVNPVRVPYQGTYVEAGATAEDPYYGTLTGEIKMTGEVNTEQLGVYLITYEVENKDGLKDQITRKVIVEPTRPTITLNGETPQSLLAGESYVEQGATASDLVDGDLTSRIDIRIAQYHEAVKDGKKIVVTEYPSILESNALKEYGIEYQVTNNSGLTAKTVRKITILPTDGPTIELTPASNSEVQKSHSIQIKVTKKENEIDVASLKYAFVSEQQQVPLNSSIESLLQTKFINNGTVKTPVGSGNYKLYVIAKDVYGNTTIKSSGYYKIDNSNPLLTLEKDSYMTLLLNHSYVEPGYTAFDTFFDGDLTSAVTVTGSVDTSKKGLQTLRYSVSDHVGNKTDKTRTISVVTPKPRIYLNGDRTQTLLVGSSYLESGATAFDEVDGDLTSKVTISGTVDTSKEGTYIITYQVENSFGEKSSITRTVFVSIPSPVITILGDNPLTLKIGSTYQDPGATATDEVDGDLTSKVTMTSNVNPTKKGTYYVEYRVTNQHQKTTTAKREVRVIAPKPTITLNGEAVVTVFRNEVYKELGATASDEVDGDLTSAIKQSGTVDPSKKGIYQVKYSVTNRYLETTEIIRYVEVRDYTVKITLSGENPYTMKVTDHYKEPGYFLTHEKLGDVTGDVQITSTVREGTPGTYQVNYRYQDRVTGQVETTVRTVIIQTPALTLSLNGSNPYQLYAGNGYIEQGATAIDEVDGDLSNKIVVTTDVNPNRIGTYTTTYTVTSNYGVVKTIQRKVSVLAQDGPIISFGLNGSSTYAEQYTTTVTIQKNKADLDEASYYYLWNDTLTTPKESDFTQKLTNGQEVTTPVLEGKYYLWVLAKDVTGSATIQSSKAFYLDNTAPLIRLNGGRVIEIPIDGVYKELGATVTETGAGLTSEGLKITSTVNPSQFGSYTVTYTAEDKLGHKAVPVTRTVTVVEAKLIDAPSNNGQTENKYYAEYFVGENPNNWILFGNAATNDIEYIPYYFRIVKMDSEGIKIVFEGTKGENGTIEQNGTLDFSEFGTTGDYNTSSVLSKLQTWFTTIKEENKSKFTAKVGWCIGKTSSPYTTSQFKTDECSTKSALSEVGLLTGGDYLVTTSNACTGYNQSSCGVNNYLKKSYDFYTLTGDTANPDYFFVANKNGALTRTKADSSLGVRPVINLKANVLIMGGDGSFENPYKLNTREAITDTGKPTVTFDKANYHTNSSEAGVTVTVTDSISGVNPNSLKYIWSTSTSTPAESAFQTEFHNGEKILQTTQGKYYLYILAKDRVGNTTIVRSGLYTLDKTAPVLTMAGTNPVTIKQNATYTDAGATATDNVDGTITTKIVTTSTVNVAVGGTYTVTYEVSDIAGNKTTAVRTVLVQETVPPVITFEPNGNRGYQASDATKVSVSDNVAVDETSLKYVWTTSTSQPSTTTINKGFQNGESISVPSGSTATYYLWILAKDVNGNQKIQSSAAFYIDNTKPVITLTGDSIVSLNVGDTYMDLGATATDNIDGQITDKIIVTSDLNPMVAGAYTIRYNVSDACGNTAVEVIRNIFVGIDTVTTYAYTGSEQEFKAAYTGKYKLEVWGAGTNVAKGGYSIGTVTLDKDDILWVYIGGSNTNGGYNGGGANNYAPTGGGATDIRLNSGDWNSTNGLYSRIIVAGGAGSHKQSSAGGVGGGATGTRGYGPGNGVYLSGGEGGYQNKAGAGARGYCNTGKGGTFGAGGAGGIGGSGYCGVAAGNGGGGWFGGGGGGDEYSTKTPGAGGGGSGYVLTATSVKPTGYLATEKYYMSSDQSIAGNASMPNPSGGTMTGRSGDGYARITYIGQ